MSTNLSCSNSLKRRRRKRKVGDLESPLASPTIKSKKQKLNDDDDSHISSSPSIEESISKSNQKSSVKLNAKLPNKSKPTINKINTMSRIKTLSKKQQKVVKEEPISNDDEDPYEVGDSGVEDDLYDSEFEKKNEDKKHKKIENKYEVTCSPCHCENTCPTQNNMDCNTYHTIYVHKTLNNKSVNDKWKVNMDIVWNVVDILYNHILYGKVLYDNCGKVVVWKKNQQLAQGQWEGIKNSVKGHSNKFLAAFGSDKNEKYYADM